MNLRDVLARALSDSVGKYGWLRSTPSNPVVEWQVNAQHVIDASPALAAAERVLAAADQWNQTDSIRDRKRLSEAVGDFRAYRSAVEEK